MDAATKRDFYHAIRNGDLQAVKKYIDSGINLNDKIGPLHPVEVPLAHACHFNHFNIIKELLIAGADPNKAVYYNPNIFHFCYVNYIYVNNIKTEDRLLIFQWDCELARLFLKYGLDPTQIICNGASLYGIAGRVKKVRSMWSEIADMVIHHVERRTEMATRIQRWWRELYWNPKRAYCCERIRKQIQSIERDVIDKRLD